MIWFKIKKQNNTSINGVDLGQKPKIDIVLQEEKQPEIKLFPRKIIKSKKK